jgi:hypothetical protein
MIKKIENIVDECMRYRPYATTTLMIAGAYIVEFFLGGTAR